MSVSLCVCNILKPLVTLLNKMAHCCSYDDLRAVDTSIATEVLAKVQEYGTVVTSNICPGSFAHLAVDNNDINEVTLDAKIQQTQGQLGFIRKKEFGPEPHPTPLGHHGKRRRSLQTTQTVIDHEECSVHGNRSAVAQYVGHVDKEWFKGESDELKCASSNDVSWKILRSNDRCLAQDQVVEALENQFIPSWSGFHSILFSDIPRADNICDCPLIEESSTVFSTIYTVLKHAQAISAIVGQTDTVITFDLASYIKAKKM